MKIKDLKQGHIFGLWTIVKFVGRDKKYFPQFLCRCVCGTLRNVRGYALTSSASTCCGCRKPGGHGHRIVNGKPSGTYESWKNMIQRCTNPNAHNFKWYGEKGVKVCRRWLKFENFLADLGIRPTNETLDRIDPKGNYTPKNCRWADATIQANNKNKKPMGKITAAKLAA